MKSLLELYKSIYTKPVTQCFVINPFEDVTKPKQLKSKKKVVGLGFSQLVE